MTIEKMTERMGRIVKQRPGVVVAVFLVMTGMLATQLANIELATEFEDFMPGHEVTRANSIVEEDFGTAQMMLIVEKSENVLLKDYILI